MGGMVALSCALRHAQHVRRLVLIDTSPSGVMARMAVPTLRALGAWRTLKVLSRAVTYLTWWSWRPESNSERSHDSRSWRRCRKAIPASAQRSRPRETLSDNANAAHVGRYAATYDVVDRLRRSDNRRSSSTALRDAPFVARSRLLTTEGIPDTNELALEGVGHHLLVGAHYRVIAAVEDFRGRS